MPLPSISFAISRFASITQPIAVKSNLTLDQLLDLLGTAQVRPSKDGPLFSFAFYDPQNPRRSDAGVIGLSGLALDIDNSIGHGDAARCSEKPSLPGDFAESLNGYAYGWYSTHSSHPNWPRWRLWIPLARPIATQEFQRAHAGLLALLRNDRNIDRTCGELSRCYYLPSVTPAGKAYAFAGFNPGELIAPEKLIARATSAAPVVTIAPITATVTMPKYAGRNDRLKAIATAMIYRGEPNDVIAGVLLAEDEKNHPPLFTDHTEGFEADSYSGASRFLAGIRLSINRDRANRGEPLALPCTLAAPQAPSSPLRVVQLDDLMASQPPAPRFVITPLVPAGEVTLLGGHGGSGKSMLALILAAHFAAQRPWASFVPNGGKTAFVSLEDPKDVVRYRLRLIIETYQLDAAAVLQNLILIDGTDGDGVLATEISEHGIRKLIGTPCFEDLRKLIGDARLIVVDNASDAFDGNENDRRIVRAFVRMLAKIARINDAGLLLLAHIDKHAARNGSQRNSYSGSTAWNNSVRSRLALVETDRGLELRQEKVNNGKQADSVQMRRSDCGVLIPEAGAFGGKDESALSVDCFGILDAIRKAKALGVDVPTGRSGPSTTLKALSTVSHFLTSISRDRFWRALNRLIEDGTIVVEHFTKPSRHKGTRFVERAAPDMRARDSPTTPAN